MFTGAYGDPVQGGVYLGLLCGNAADLEADLRNSLADLSEGVELRCSATFPKLPKQVNMKSFCHLFGFHPAVPSHPQRMPHSRFSTCPECLKQGFYFCTLICLCDFPVLEGGHYRSRRCVAETRVDIGLALLWVRHLFCGLVQIIHLSSSLPVKWLDSIYPAAILWR